MSSFSSVILKDPLIRQAIAWKTLACFCFAISAGLVRLMSKSGLGLPVFEIAFLEYTLASIVIMPFFLKQYSFGTLFKQSSGYYIRTFVAIAGVLFFYFSLMKMQISIAVSLGFISPILAVLGAVLFLRERPSNFQRFAIFASILGTFMISRPDKALLSSTGLLAEVGIFILLPIAYAISIALAKVLSRQLVSRGGSSKILTFLFILFMPLATAIPTYFQWQSPSSEQLVYVVILSFVHVIAHFATIKSFEFAGVSFLTPFSFLRMILSIGVGYILFTEIPSDISIWLGIAAILLSTWLVSLQKTSPKPSPTN